MLQWLEWGVVDVEADQGVVARGGLQHGCANAGEVEIVSRVIGEFDGLYLVEGRAQRAVAEHALDGQDVRGARHLNRQIVAGPREGQIGEQNPGAENDLVVASVEAAEARIVVDRILEIEAENLVVAGRLGLGEQAQTDGLLGPYRAGRVAELEGFDLVETLGAEHPGVGGGELVDQRQACCVVGERKHQVERIPVARHQHVLGCDVEGKAHPVDRRGENGFLTLLDHVLAEFLAELVRVVVLATGKEIVTRAAVQRIGAEEAVDQIVAFGIKVLKDLIHHLVVGEIGSLGELESFNPVEPHHPERPGIDRLELVDNRQAVVGHPIDGNHQIERIRSAGEHDVVEGDAGTEIHIVRVVQKHQHRLAGNLVVHRVMAIRGIRSRVHVENSHDVCTAIDGQNFGC